MAIEIPIEAEETRGMYQYNESIPQPAKSDKPWEKVTPEVLGGLSLLEPMDHVSSLEVDILWGCLSQEIFEIMDWKFITQPGSRTQIIMDVIKAESGQVSAILQWEFDHGRRYPVGSIIPDSWMEARARFELSAEDAEYIVKKLDMQLRNYREFNQDIMDRMQALSKSGLSLKLIFKQREAVLRQAGLDVDCMQAQLDPLAIEARQGCLKQAGLDNETVNRKVDEFDKQWRDGREAKKALDYQYHASVEELATLEALYALKKAGVVREGDEVPEAEIV